MLPPPEYIIEAQLVTLQLADETDPAQVAALIERGSTLRLEFENRHEYWKRELPPGSLSDAMNVTAYRRRDVPRACRSRAPPARGRTRSR